MPSEAYLETRLAAMRLVEEAVDLIRETEVDRDQWKEIADELADAVRHGREHNGVAPTSCLDCRAALNRYEAASEGVATDRVNRLPEQRATEVIASVLRGDTAGNVIGAYRGSPTDAVTDARGLLRALHEAGLQIEEARRD